METPYRAVNFDKHDIVTRDRADQIQNNLQWIKDNTPRGRFYVPDAAPVETLSVLVSGRARINKSKKKDTRTVGVRFGAKMFAAECRPAVTTGVIANFQRNIFCVTHGLKSTNVPDSNGFQITVNIDADKNKEDFIKKDFWVHWHAFGYRTEEMAYGIQSS